jgi:hypothetical protein
MKKIFLIVTFLCIQKISLASVNNQSDGISSLAQQFSQININDKGSGENNNNKFENNSDLICNAFFAEQFNNAMLANEKDPFLNQNFNYATLDKKIDLLSNSELNPNFLLKKTN